MRAEERSSWDDRRLVLAAQAGDNAAADVLFARYDQYLLRVAANATGSGDEAAEAAAAGRARAWEKLGTLRDPDRFGPWAAAIVRNSAVDAQRRRAREVPRAEAPEMAYTEEFAGDADEHLDRLNRARSAVLALSARDRKALELAVFRQLPVAEVAAALQIDPNAAYQVLHRARKRVRKAYLTPHVPDSAPEACRECARQTPDYVRGVQAVRQAVDGHVESCRACRARLAEILAESSHIKGVFGFLLPVAAALRVVWGRRPRLPKRPATQVAVLTCVVVGLAAGITTIATQHGQPASLLVKSPASTALPATGAAGRSVRGSGPPPADTTAAAPVHPATAAVHPATAAAHHAAPADPSAPASHASPTTAASPTPTATTPVPVPATTPEPTTTPTTVAAATTVAPSTTTTTTTTTLPPTTTTTTTTTTTRPWPWWGRHPHRP